MRPATEEAKAPSLGEEHELLRASIREFVAREIAQYVHARERAGEVPRAVHQKAGAAGSRGIGCPEEIGGSGGDLFHTMVLVEEIVQGGGSSGVCAALLTHGIALPPIITAGDPAQLRRWAHP